MLDSFEKNVDVVERERDSIGCLKYTRVQCP
jgi:hypothetical protein